MKHEVVTWDVKTLYEAFKDAKYAIEKTLRIFIHGFGLNYEKGGCVQLKNGLLS